MKFKERTKDILCSEKLEEPNWVAAGIIARHVTKPCYDLRDAVEEELTCQAQKGEWQKDGVII